MPVNIAAVMAKLPVLSKVKTRLAKTIGKPKALKVYEILLDNLCEKCLPSDNNSFKLGCFITPSNKTKDFYKLYSSFAFYRPQKGNDLGERMNSAFQNIFSEFHAAKAILIGADIPDLHRDIIENAFRKLMTNDVVIGPTDDGGYYLIGMRQTESTLFENIPWGTSHVLEQTFEVCQKNILSVGILELLSDLDTEEDLKKYPIILSKLQ